MKGADAQPQARIEALIAELEPVHDPRLAPAKELVQVVLELHGAGLAALMEIATQHGEAGRSVIDACLRNRDVSALLLLHGLHPDPLETRVRQALASVRAELGAQGLAVQLVAVEGERVNLKLTSSAQRNFSVPKVRSQIEAAVLELAPEVAGIELEGLPAAGEVAFVPLASLRSPARAGEASDAR